MKKYIPDYLNDYLIKDLTNIVLSYIDNFRFQFDCCVWEMGLRFYQGRHTNRLEKKGYLPLHPFYSDIYWFDLPLRPRWIAKKYWPIARTIHEYGFLLKKGKKIKIENIKYL